MARADIPNGVLTIIASFSNGLEILRKLRSSDKKRPRRSKVSKQTDDDALRLSRSLRHGPEEIGREYQAGSMRCDSERFAAGDATAQNCLAEILLKLNTGLVGIISSFTNRGKTQHDLDYRALTDLSEQSRIQTVDVLRQLCQRLMVACVPANLPQARSDKMKSSKPRHRSPTKPSKKRYPTLARVLIENSSVPSQIALVRQSDTRKQRTAPRPSPRCEPPKYDKEKRLAASSGVELPSLPPLYSSSGLALEASAPYSKTPRHQCSCNSIQKSRNTSKDDIPIVFPVSTTPNEARITDPVPTSATPHNDRIPVDPKFQRMRPNTFYSVASARTGSTKLGEIPMHKWAEPWDYKAAEQANREALASGWPVSANTGTGKQKKGGWKRWFGKKADST